ncbi:MAG TPA: cytochrome C oxidase subunit II [Gemmatimonadetes bacterium]|jgi:cytochrome c oxidase subunit 2|nr:cytochrome C oxidase subunit II [Gemmatimonadota bacterium]HCK61106.1 cytochrome C oxidase subunit II [Gemmatimonadota bacterium]HCW79446.1 cytochrome C oxidase subunit II [Gemmatimonadota bacterium]|tara:strand:+ start:2294 stop:2965 length:672 start_codon:yes stop_codon:yes gene_type:complete
MLELVQASTYAADIDRLILLIGVIVGVWFLLAEGIFFWLIWKFRAKPGERTQYLDGTEKHVKKWITIPHALVLVCDVFILVGAVSVWYNVKQQLPDADSTIRVIGQQWAWTFQHPGADNELDTGDDIFTVGDLHVEVEKTYHFQLQSRDVLHSFSVPVFRLKQDAIPGRSITGWFTPTRTGEHDVQCSEICGIGHGVMAARIHIEDANTHAAWINRSSAATTP